jgi:hypothetical protein
MRFLKLRPDAYVFATNYNPASNDGPQLSAFYHSWIGTFIFNAYEAFLHVQQVAGQHLL